MYTLQKATVGSSASSSALRRSHSANVSLNSSDSAAAANSSSGMSTPQLYGSASVLLADDDSHSLTIAASKR
jgi:hypothetical protein